ncbi:keratin, type II cytoskeletal 1-like [Dermacentor silvarum]|uniref:keratin, type II cytoskeletal 1-like n=1 Tax=Dermacentor silvarum TaxID=543639 RepID=UPI0021010229|nr:keratin, type II cytoskeletal 1-like [Dermacentor silvarum]
MGGGLLDVGGPVGGYLGQMGPGARAGYDTPGIDYGIGPVGGGGTFGANYQGGGALTNLGSYGPGFMGGQFGGVGPMGGGANLGTVTGIVANGVRGSLSRDRNEEREDRRARRREERERRREERRRLREERRLLREEKRRERLERRRLGSRRSDSEEDLAAARREKATLGLSAVSAGLSAVNTVGTLSTLGRLGAFGGGNNVGGLGGGISGRRCTTCI